MSGNAYGKCGNRCDLCLLYRPNVEVEDKRSALCEVFSKIWTGYQLDPETVICDGCACERFDAVLFSPLCETRKCVISKGLEHCGKCDSYPCAVFPAEPSQEELHQKIDVEKQWTWEDESLMEAYACKRYMDAFRNSR